MNKQTLLLSFAASTITLASAAQAAMLQSWETNEVGTSAGGLGMIVDSGAGITDGTKAARATTAAGAGTGFAKVAEFNISDSTPTPITRFIVDWHYGGDPAGSGANEYFGLTAAIYNGPGTWKQLTGSKSGPGGNEYIGPGAGQYTVQYDLNATELAQVAANVGTGNLKLEFFANKHETRSGVLTVDNIRSDAVPEPASLALVAGAAGLLTRRRRI